MIKPTRNAGVHMTTHLTPFEQTHVRAASAGARIIESLALNQMIAQARAYEHDMSKLGAGTPPLSETIIIGTMWGAVSQFADSEIEA
jgi:hypothetical protein